MQKGLDKVEKFQPIKEIDKLFVFGFDINLIDAAFHTLSFGEC
jgi:hypothetical protein